MNYGVMKVITKTLANVCMPWGGGNLRKSKEIIFVNDT